MSTITTINTGDVVANSRAVINANFEALNADKAETLSDLGLTDTAANYNAAASNFLPSGSIVAWVSNTAPASWYLCNGQALSRTAFAALFAVIGTTYGAGDGSTTFNVPNLVGRTIVARDAGQTEFDTIGETGGAKTHTLTIPEMPSHSHVLPYLNLTTGTQTVSTTFDTTATLDYSQPTNVSQATGGGGAHNNLQPYFVLNYIIKA